jgi:CBS domain containing-hemolysin-like protein
MSELKFLAISLGLLIVNGFFVASEYSLTAVNRERIEQLASAGDRRAARVRRSIEFLPLMLAGTQLGITMASLVLGYVAEPAVGRLFEGVFGHTPLGEGLITTISFLIALTIVVFFHLVLSEMVPKYIVIAESERAALWLAAPFSAYITVFKPILVVLNAIGNAGLRRLKVEPRTSILSAYTLDEFADIIEESAGAGEIVGVEQRLLTGAVGFTGLDAGAVMVPRTEIVAVRNTATPADVEGKVLESGHTRLPVYAGDLDNVLGFFHAKDLLQVPEQDRDRAMPRRLIRQMLVVPESRNLLSLLFEMRRERRHFALVVEEHGGTAGILSIENILEELVGEIRDEYDFSELGIEDVGDGRWIVPGTLRIDEAADFLGATLPVGEYETVAGFVMDRLGRVPHRGDSLTIEGWRIRVMAMHRRRVVQLTHERMSQAQPGER